MPLKFKKKILSCPEQTYKSQVVPIEIFKEQEHVLALQKKV